MSGERIIVQKNFGGPDENEVRATQHIRPLLNIKRHREVLVQRNVRFGVQTSTGIDKEDSERTSEHEQRYRRTGNPTQTSSGSQELLGNYEKHTHALRLVIERFTGCDNWQSQRVA